MYLIRHKGRTMAARIPATPPTLLNPAARITDYMQRLTENNGLFIAVWLTNPLLILIRISFSQASFCTPVAKYFNLKKMKQAYWEEVSSRDANNTWLGSCDENYFIWNCKQIAQVAFEGGICELSLVNYPLKSPAKLFYLQSVQWKLSGLTRIKAVLFAVGLAHWICLHGAMSARRLRRRRKNLLLKQMIRTKSINIY